jgi:hypothetical protein
MISSVHNRECSFREDAADVDYSGQEPQKFPLAARPASSRAPSILPSQAQSSLSEINQRIEIALAIARRGANDFPQSAKVGPVYA